MNLWIIGNYGDYFLKWLFEEYFKHIATKDWKTLTCFEQNALKLTVTLTVNKNCEGPTSSSHRIVASSIHIYTPHLNTEHWTAWMFAVSGAQQKNTAVSSCIGSVFDKHIPWISWISEKNGQNALHDLFFSKNHRLLSVLTHLTTTLWCMFIEKASRPHDHVSAKKNASFPTGTTIWYCLTSGCNSTTMASEKQLCESNKKQSHTYA